LFEASQDVKLIVFHGYWPGSTVNFTRIEVTLFGACEKLNALGAVDNRFEPVKVCAPLFVSVKVMVFQVSTLPQ